MCTLHSWNPLVLFFGYTTATFFSICKISCTLLYLSTASRGFLWYCSHSKWSQSEWDIDVGLLETEDIWSFLVHGTSHRKQGIFVVSGRVDGILLACKPAQCEGDTAIWTVLLQEARGEQSVYKLESLDIRLHMFNSPLTSRTQLRM